MRGIAAHFLASLVLVSSTAGASAQWRWREDGSPERVAPEPRNQWQREQSPWGWDRGPPPRFQPQPYASPYASPPPFAPPGGDIRDGGGQPEIVPVAPPIVPFNHAYPANSIVIDSDGRRLYFVLPGNTAFSYQIAVGREGFNWAGTEVVTRKQAWPDWHPPAEMRERDPSLPEKMTGGSKNPLGAMALYLGKTLYRIHGTNDEKSLGQAGSSGCFRMLNANVLHLAAITDVGTTVTVVKSLAPPRTSGLPRQQVQQQVPPPYADPQVPRAGPPPRTRRDTWSDWDRAPDTRQPRDWPGGWR